MVAVFILDMTFSLLVFFFFFNDTATTEIYTLSLHDALPIFRAAVRGGDRPTGTMSPCPRRSPRSLRRWGEQNATDRKSTRLNSSHGYISYAVFCLKKKKNNQLENAYHQLSTYHQLNTQQTSF